jgi:LmbE family N-acetylglucosaminyl deacetylase
MKALCMVAHPDDCVIFGYSYIHNHPEYDWTIGYLTYTESDSRGAELAAFWRCRNIPTVFLGYVDDYRDLETGQLSFDAVQAEQDIQQLTQQYDLVLTHDEHGDYGHLHHVFVHRCVQNHQRLVTFAGVNSGNVRFSVPAGTYSLSELPGHRDVVSGFFPNGVHENNYTEVAK